MKKYNYVVFSKILCLFLILGLMGTAWPLSAADRSNQITSPEKFFGFQLGSDRHIARWDKIVDYFYLLEKESQLIKVVNMGPSTMGNPFLVVFISAADNLAQLERYQKINAQLSDPRGLGEEEAKKLVKEGKAVICQSMSLHATEIGGTQMAPELAYDLLTRQDVETRRILENVIFVMIPCFNPDGQIMVTDWYNQTLGTEYEGSGLPWLYHKYAGHDNNRDGDYLNLVESKYAAKILYRDWIPQAYIDHHHMGSYGARFYVPPYCDPIRPYADPLIWREISWFGAHIALKLEEAGKTGILNDAQFPGWGHFGWHWITPFHNIAGMLTESASARLATPIFIHPDQLRAGALHFPEYEPQSTFPHPWPGGWWRLRDIVEQQKISAWALLDIAARNKETVLWNAYLKAKRQIERGAQEKPRAYLVPPTQHDYLTAVKMINTLWESGVEIKQTVKDFKVDGVIYPRGTFVISLAQPKMGLIRNLLGRTFYPDNEWTRDRDGSPRRPYDLATHTMAEFMGVRVDPVNEAVEAEAVVLKEPVKIKGKVEKGRSGLYILDGRLNDSFRAVNLLLNQKEGEIWRVDLPGEKIKPGDFIIRQAKSEILQKIAAEMGVNFQALEEMPSSGVHQLRRLRTAMYQRYWGGNMDEGWTRLLLEKFDFPYKSVKDKEIKNGQLTRQYDVLILPHDSAGMMLGEKKSSAYRRYLSSVPSEYRSGLGEDGLTRIKEFVRQGGRLLALGNAGELIIEKFNLSLRNVVQNLDSKEFFCPGSTLKVKFNNQDPLAYGLPEEGYILLWFNPVLTITPTADSDKYRTIVRYQERDILQSGWLIGEKYIAKKSAMVAVKYGEGEIIIISFRPQHRCQTHGTFKLLFNALVK
jgi:hypothetical protein